MMKQLLCAAMLLLQLGAVNAMELKADSSSLSFVSIKNDAIAETMSFSSLTGSIDDKTGKAEIVVGLNSIASGIDIRNERMRKYLFETDKFPAATYTALVDMPELVTMSVGEQKTMKLTGALVMHGTSSPLSFDVIVTKRADGALHVVTLAPSFVDTQRFGLVAGVAKLRSLAGLNNIGLAVPVSFSVTFQ
ncbi:YceI family protein [Zhongshania aliphaticivorans]|uniref:YceI family protein n=1 Tax=Zhongshania aliphaticivorans TaxID=1470434 RepID=UPI0039E527FE